MTERIEGTVTKITSVLAEVDVGGRTYQCKARGRLIEADWGETKPLAVGDRVAFTPIEDGEDEGVIEEVLPRRTKLSRRLPRDPRIEHVIVANVDQALIVASVRKPPLTAGIIDRYIIAGEAGGLEPIICINKIDLAEEPGEYLGLARMYGEMEYPVVLTSATERRGLEELKELLRGKSTVLAGHSGVGKSSLLNAIQPGLDLRTGAVDYKGRHCTTWVSLLKLEFGGYVVDTPGIREYDLWDIEKHEVQQFFPWIWERSHECDLPDCIHVHEPGCAVKQALEAGEMPRSRYESYLRIVDTIEEQEVPRRTDVEQPEEQISRRQRRPSRSTRRQELLREAERYLSEQDMDEEEEPRR